MNAYSKKEMIYEKGFLDNCVDATYIINLEGNGRLQNIYNQLNQYQPTKKIYIFFNKGYKNCNKKLYKNTPSYDLIDTYINIFKDAKSQNYKNILILEDDFIFDEKILNIENTNEICNFIQNKDEEYVYILGCVPFVQIPSISYNRNVLLKMGTHACIYTEKMMEKILNTKQSIISDWDVYMNFNLKQYMFYEPLCYQLFPQTENRKEWFYVFIFSELRDILFSFFKLHETFEYGYIFFYWLSCIFLILCVLVLIYVYFIIKNRFIK
jgi:hypothetical protein